MYKLPKEFKKELNKIIYEHVFEKYLKEFFNNKKEVKKVNKIPYFETKVVRVKGEKVKYIPDRCRGCNINKKCVGVEGEIEREQKAKGNWVNGENIDKIKFPCFCSFSCPVLKDYRYGMIINEGYFKDYILVEFKSSQSNGNMVRDKANSLKALIRYWDIHILKGKITIFEEEENNEK